MSGGWICRCSKIRVNLFHFCGRWVNIFWSGWNCQFHPLPRWQWQIQTHVLLFTHSVQSETIFTVDEFTHFKTVCFLHPHYFKTNHSRNSPIQLLSDRSIWGTTTSTQHMCEWVLSFIIIHVLIHTFESHFLPTVRGGVYYDQRCCLCSLHVIFTHGFLSSQKSIFTFLWQNKNERHLQTKKNRDIYHQFSPTTFHTPLWPTRVPIHAQTPTKIHPFNLTNLFLPTHFHPPITPTFFHLPFLTHLFSPSPFPPSLIPFTRCAIGIDFHPRLFALWFHSLADFTCL